MSDLCDDPCGTVNYMHSNPARQWASVTRSGHGYYMSLVGGASLDLDWVPFKKLSLWPAQSHSAKIVEHSGAQQAPFSGQHGTYSGPQLSKVAGVVHSPRPGPQHEAHVWGWQGEIQQAQVKKKPRIHLDMFDVFSKLMLILFYHPLTCSHNSPLCGFITYMSNLNTTTKW